MGARNWKLVPLWLITAMLLCAPTLAFGQETEEAVEAQDEEATEVAEAGEAGEAEQIDAAQVRDDTAAWTWVIGRNALAGGITGALIGAGFFLLTMDTSSPWLIAQFAGGGILVGTGIGLVELLVDGDRFALEPPHSTSWVLQGAPMVRPVGGLELSF